MYNSHFWKSFEKPSTYMCIIYISGGYRISKRGVQYDKITRSARKNFKPCPLFFQPRPFKAHFLAQNEWLCWSIDLFTIENDAKVNHRKSRSTLAPYSTKSISLSSRASQKGGGFHGTPGHRPLYNDQAIRGFQWKPLKPP